MTVAIQIPKSRTMLARRVGFSIRTMPRTVVIIPSDRSTASSRAAT